jgi:uncharacterized lipoprotein YmbA
MKGAILVMTCAACFGGSRPNYQYYVLTSRPAPAATRSAPGQRTLVIEQVAIPGYLDREQIANRTSGQHLVYSTTDRWAEPLDKAFERTLTDDLAALLAPRGIEVRSHGEHPTYDLSVEVERFEQAGPQRVELRARWMLRADRDVLDGGEARMQIAMTGIDTNAMAAALSESIARMATEVAGRVEESDAIALREHERG